MYQIHKECRACGSVNLEPVFSLGVQPLANDFTMDGESHQGFAPLEVLFCPECTLGQLSITVDPRILYSRYLYVTSESDTMRRHFDRLFCDINSEQETRFSIVEIGANDGACLRAARKHAFKMLIGIDPAKNLIPSEGGMYYVGECFNQSAASLAKDLLNSSGADVILARHCFCHINDWHEFIAACEKLSGPETLICIEVPYVTDLLNRTEFDTIYHEHTSYLTLKSVAALLKSSDYHIHRVIPYGVHGGCILIMLRHNSSQREPHLSAEEYLSGEKVTSEQWHDFSRRAQKKLDALRLVIDKLPGESILSGFGASAKGTVWINALGPINKRIKFVTDNSPLKPGRLVPGTNIPIIPEDQLLSEHPTHALLWAWNYETEIRVKQRRWIERGGKFINPHEPVI